MNDKFRQTVSEELENLLLRGQSLVPQDERLRIDLHCHDLHSDRPDERLGRILGIPETWVTTDDLVRTLQGNGTDLLTVTNHNDARTCWNLLEAGRDVLVGAEFSCTLPDFDVGVHVLTYGFDPRQEERLKRLRRDVYRFVDYCNEQDLVTVLAHPLQFHSPKGLPPMEVMDRLGLLFERFEVVNGQRDAWQNVLTATWVEGMDEEEIRAMARRVRQSPDLFVRHPWRKAMTGGSDDHMAMFAGSTGTMLRIPELAQARRDGRKLSALALEALRRGDCAPYGGTNQEEKLAAALLDYFCQVVLHMEDPGLVRMLLHKGEPSEKALALAVANGVFELRRHKTTMGFLKIVHQAFAGKAPGLGARLATSRDFRPLLDRLSDIARARREGSRELVDVVDTALPAIFRHLGELLARRVQDKSERIEGFLSGLRDSSASPARRLELPSDLRRLFGGGARRQPEALPGLGKLVDGLPYPLLSALVVGGASYAATRVLNEKRPFLDAFAERLGKHRHPHRALWLTDTFGDRNGVSSALASLLAEIRERNLPIDLCVVSDTLVEEDHLRVLRPIATFTLAAHSQPIRVPDLLEARKLFSTGAYDRLVCSTEGPMGLVALFLKNAFEVPAWFFVHTDWMDFARTTLGWDRAAMSRLRRLLRAFYSSFDGLFVLNSQMRDWFVGPQMNMASDRVHATAHWVEDGFRPSPDRSRKLLGGVPDDVPVLLFAGRVSDEKGVGDLPAILRRVRQTHPGARLAIAGTGPALERLLKEIPDAISLGWCDQAKLVEAYSAADFLVLPSRFDTFGCVVLEAMACGLPVAAYATKGPRDIVQPGASGILADSAAELGSRIADALSDPRRHAMLRLGALERVESYQAEPILRALLADLGLGEQPMRKRPRPAAPDAGLLTGLLDLVQGA
ncbi:MAG: glycosyltransferase [Fibrobacteria bacterium]|nr:glycosyltransferase [Fibrobacteria bacterium]